MSENTPWKRRLLRGVIGILLFAAILTVHLKVDAAVQTAKGDDVWFWWTMATITGFLLVVPLAAGIWFWGVVPIRRKNAMIQRLYREERQRGLELQVLHSTSQAASHGTTVAQILREAVKGVEQIVPGLAAAVLTVDEATGAVEVTNWPPEIPATEFLAALSRATPADLYAGGNVEAPGAVSVVSETPGFAGFLAMPLMVEGQAAGYLAVFPRQVLAVGSREVHLLTTIAGQVSTAAANLLLLAEVRRQATHDGPTGLLNHRTFWQIAESEVEKSVRERKNLALLMVDIDHFKEVNDTYGHPAGDAVIKRVAEVLRDCVRRADSVGRHGGEEFVALLPAADVVAGLKVGGIMRQRVEACNLDDIVPGLRITVSIGVADMAGSGPDARSLLNVADQRLYEAKRGGRNRVEGGSE